MPLALQTSVSFPEPPTECVSSWPVFDLSADSGGLLVTPLQILFDLVLMLEVVEDRAVDFAQAEGWKIILDLLGR